MVNISRLRCEKAIVSKVEDIGSAEQGAFQGWINGVALKAIAKRRKGT